MALSAVGARSKRKRDQLSPFYHPAADPRYQFVHANETHIDFPEHDRALGSAESSIATTFRAARGGAIRDVAVKLARAVKGGRLPSAVAFDHDADLRSRISKITGRAYAFGKQAALDEHSRLLAKITNHKSQIANERAALADAGPASGPADIPNLYAEIAVEDFGNQIGAQGRNAANDLRKKLGADIADMDAGELADALFGAIGDYSDGFIDRIAAEAARSAVGAGRADALEICKRELAEANGFYERTSVLDKNTCDACEAADGDQLPAKEGPPPYPWIICAGGEGCRCQWYAVILAGAEAVN